MNQPTKHIPGYSHPSVRDDTPFEEWLREQEMGIVLTRGEREQLGQAARAIVGMLQDGAATLIEAAGKGAGEAVRI